MVHGSFCQAAALKRTWGNLSLDPSPKALGEGGVRSEANRGKPHPSLPSRGGKQGEVGRGLFSFIIKPRPEDLG